MFGLARAVDKDVIEVNNHELPKKTLTTWFINLMKVLGALDSPKGMTIHSMWNLTEFLCRRMSFLLRS